MPKELEQSLERSAAKRGLTGDRRDAYVYGTLRKTGWKPERELHDKIKLADKVGHDHG